MSSPSGAGNDSNGEEPRLQVKFSVMPDSLSQDFRSLFTGYGEGLVRSEPGGLVMTPAYGNVGAEKIYRIKPRKDDVWLLTFPKCGTTWTAELLWQVVHGCNIELAAKVPLIARVPFPEVNYLGLSPGSGAAEAKNPMLLPIAAFEQIPSPRLIRPHLPFYLLPPNLLDTCKVIYVARNPKDVIVSFYHHHRLIKNHGYVGDLKTFAEYFMQDKILYSPYFPHVLDAWSKRHHPNMHFIFYEDMKRDLRGEIAKVAAFLDRKLSDDQLDRLAEHLRFENFAKNESVNNEPLKKMGHMNLNEGNFCRKGKTGDWKNHFDDELNERIDKWVESNLAGTDLKFVTELEHQD